MLISHLLAVADKADSGRGGQRNRRRMRKQLRPDFAANSSECGWGLGNQTVGNEATNRVDGDGEEKLYLAESPFAH